MPQLLGGLLQAPFFHQRHREVIARLGAVGLGFDQVVERSRRRGEVTVI